MYIHEFQTKEILQKYGVPVPPYTVISEGDPLPDHGEKVVLKIQVHAGGRGKGGGVKIARSKAEQAAFAKQLLGLKLVNAQTGPGGITTQQILLTPAVDFVKEYYIGAIIDRERAEGILILSPEGGVEIEEVAQNTPEKILKIPLNLQGKLHTYQLIEAVKFMGWTGDIAAQGKAILVGLAKAFVETDASLLEINPLVETRDGKLWALDAKLSIDDNALFRHPELAALYDPSQLPSNEAQAKKFDLAFVALDGEIGCMVNGAGLAMATMDIIHHYGGKPANFLDVGGGASEEKVAEGFKILLSDPNVKAILVNIFGGIMNCETLAKGIVSAAKQLQLKVPLIVRMEGTNVEQGKQILAQSKLNIQIANGLDEAARMVTKES